MGRNKYRTGVSFILAILILTVAITVATAAMAITGNIGFEGFISNNKEEAVATFTGNFRDVKETNIRFSKNKSAGEKTNAGKRYYPGGIPFGVKLSTEGAFISGFTNLAINGNNVCPAYEAGLRTNDSIIGINGKSVSAVEDVIRAVAESGGAALNITVKRKGSEMNFSVTPVKIQSENDSEYKIGVNIRDSIAGIGTVTFVDPESFIFGGLGHGICDIDSGELMPLMKGTVNRVTINGITKGAVGAPGELRGYFEAEKNGTLKGNTSCGVFGIYARLPEGMPEGPLPIATKDEIKEGSAYIWCTTDEHGPQKYTIKITDINRSENRATRCFKVIITDPTLIEKTGGIVQGMSGSPIIQNNKLVGAVTHVMVNDPLSGYGIFIENMLSSMPEIFK